MSINFCPSAIEWGNIGEWAAALATLAAAGLALWFSLHEARVRSTERKFAARIFAQRIVHEVQFVQISVTRIRVSLWKMKILGAARENWPNLVRMVQPLSTPIIQESFETIVLLGENSAKFVIGLEGNLQSVRKMTQPWGATVEELQADPRTESLVDPLLDLTKQLQLHANGALTCCWEVAQYEGLPPIGEAADPEKSEELARRELAAAAPTLAQNA